jgi:CBS domain containing-hemolysin-like protein
MSFITPFFLFFGFTFLGSIFFLELSFSLSLLSVVLFMMLSTSFLCSLSEAALFSVPLSQIQIAVEQRRFGSKLLQQIKGSPNRIIGAIVILNNIANIVGSLAIGVIIGKEHIAVVSTLLTLVVILFAEILPKRIGNRHALSVSLYVSPLLWSLPKILYPLLLLTDLMTAFLDHDKKNITDEAEVQAMVELGTLSGGMEKSKAEMLHNIFNLYDIQTEDAMTPRVKLFALPANSVISEVLPLLLEGSYSRIPIYKEDKDKITGVILKTDALACICRGEGHKTLAEIQYTVPQVPTTMPLNRLLKVFTKSRTHLAIVRDEYGGTDGIITLEDLLEEIVGEIDDESDPTNEKITKISSTEILVDGDIDLDDINDFFEIELEDIARTIAGFIQERTHSIPSKGVSIEEKEVIISIEESNETQILKVRITRKPHPEALAL